MTDKLDNKHVAVGLFVDRKIAWREEKKSINSVNDIQMVTRLEADDNQTILSIETP